MIEHFLDVSVLDETPIDTMSSADTTELEIGTDLLCWHNFEHNKYLKESSIILA